MAQAGYTPISLYYSTTASAAPTAVNLVAGELALNTVDEKLYFKNSSGVVKLLASNAGSLGSVTSVAQSFTGGLISVSGSPITSSGTLALTVAGTSGGIPYFSSASAWASSAALAANSLVIGGGAGAAPATTTTGTGVITALGVNVGTAGAFVVNGGALGTPSSGTVTNLTGTASININGTVGATTPNTGAFTSVTSTSQVVTGASGILTRAAATQDGVALVGRSGGTGSWEVTLTPTTLTADRTLTLPDASGTILQSGTAVTVAQGGTGLTSGTSGGIPYFSSTTAITSSALLTANALMIGGGAGASPSTITTGTGVVTALGVNVGTAGAFVVNGGALGTPSSGTLTNATGLPLTTGVTGTLGVANGGTGMVSATAYAVLCGGTTSTAAHQSIASVGTSGQVLTSNGAGALPTFQTASSGGFAAGTAMVFVQTAAPTGWTKSITHDNKALRIVSGTASSGGSVAFTTAFASQGVSGTVGSTTLTSTQIPSHTHTYTAQAGGGINVAGDSGLVNTTSANTGATGGGGSHDHSFTGTAINLAVQYVDVIIATKD